MKVNCPVNSLCWEVLNTRKAFHSSNQLPDFTNILHKCVAISTVLIVLLF